MSSLNVCIIQSSLHWENHQANLNMFEEKIEQIKAGTELLQNIERVYPHINEAH